MNKIKYMKLSDVCVVQKGKQLNKSELNDSGIYEAWNGGTMFSGYTDKYNVKGETTIISQGGASAGFVNFVNYDFWANAHCYYLEPNIDIINNKYLFYFVKNSQKDLMDFKHGAGIPALDKAKIENLLISVPEIKTQNEIVEVLDKFSALEAELEAELEARTKQYDYYRNKLLDFKDESIVWIEISKVFNLRNGYTPSTKNDENWLDGTIPWFRMEDLRANGTVLSDSIRKITPKAVKGKLFTANSIIISTSATIGEYALVTVDYMSNQRFTNLEVKDKFKEKINIKFVKYYMFVISEWTKKNIRESSFASVDMDGFRKLKFPIPPLNEQERIVSILDKFSTLVTNIKEGLPAEIELRRKQYEYYRNKLLTFDKE